MAATSSQPEPSATKNADETGSGPSLWDLAIKALAAVIGGITLASFVTITGGAVHWVRFDEAGLPADPAVALVSRQELLVTGLAMLIPFLAAAVIALLVLYLIDPEAEITPDRVNNERENENAGRREEGEGKEEEGEVEDEGDKEEHPRKEKKRDRKSKLLVRRFWSGLRYSWFRALVFVALELAFFHIVAGSPERWVIVLVYFAALALALLAFGIGAHTRGFRRFGVAAFIAFAFFGALVGYLRTKESPKLHPAAVLLKDGKGLSGVYIAQTDDRIYLGSLTSDAVGHTEVHPECEGVGDRAADPNKFDAPPRAGRLFSVLRAEATALSVGQLQSPCDALARGPVLLDDLEGRYGRRKLNEWLNGWRKRDIRGRGLTVYRVYGGGSPREGRWATNDTLALSSGELARSRLALPGGNTATCVVAVKILPPSQIRIGHVAPAFGQAGGGTQIEFLFKQKLTRVRYEADRPLPPSDGPCP